MLTSGTLRGARLPLAHGLLLSLITALLLLASLTYEITSTDPAAYGTAVLVLLGTGLLASIRPACRAAARDALHALGTE